MNGSNHDEWNLFVALDFEPSRPPGDQPPSYPTAIAATIAVPAASPVVALVQAQYPGASFATFDQAVGALGTERDIRLHGPVRGRACIGVSSEPSRTSSTTRMHRRTSCLPLSFPYGASHAAENPVHLPERQPVGNWFEFAADARSTPISGCCRDRMLGYWTQFAKSGDPNGNGAPHCRSSRAERQVMQSLVPPTPTTETNFAVAHQVRGLGPADGPHVAGPTLITIAPPPTIESECFS